MSLKLSREEWELADGIQGKPSRSELEAELTKLHAERDAVIKERDEARARVDVEIRSSAQFFASLCMKSDEIADIRAERDALMEVVRRISNWNSGIGMLDKASDRAAVDWYALERIKELARNAIEAAEGE